MKKDCTECKYFEELIVCVCHKKEETLYGLNICDYFEEVESE